MKHYYATESVGIATGLLVAAIHQGGLVARTHTPSPMAFLNRILGRARTREAISAPGGRPSRRGCAGARHRAKAAGRDQHIQGLEHVMHFASNGSRRGRAVL
jgi:hypothetical protein